MPKYINVDKLDLYDDLFMKGENHSGVWVRYRDVENLLKDAPAADVQEVRHAKFVSLLVEKDDWRGRKQSYFYPNACSCCKEPLNGTEAFCYYCGAKMDGKGE